MRVKSIFVILLLIISFIFSFSCAKEEPQVKDTARLDELLADQADASNEVLAINASEYGMKYPETFVLMQNRMGLRIEYCVDRSRLSLWISPQAGQSFSYVDKNWSNRDDHTDVFDRIIFQGLSLNDFIKCDYDPFHSVLYFKNQTLHISQVYDKPAVVIWFEKEAKVDLKIYGEPEERNKHAFIINHEDRGREFQSAAVLGPGKGYFQQQLAMDDHRSVYTRAHMDPRQLLVMGAELRKENIERDIKKAARTQIKVLLAENEEKIARDLNRGQFQLKGKSEMQKLLEINRRITLSMQDFEGFMRSTNQYIYYLLWFRDGGMNTGHLTYTGWVNPVKDHAKFALLNPNVSHEKPKGNFFGQVMAGPITKWEEDGLFFVVWPAYNYWTQTGDDEFCKGKYMDHMEDGLEWIEEYCFDKEKGLFGRYHFCETPLTNSRGYGWDNATGAPSDKWESNYEGKTIVRSYDLYINALMYSTYMMMSAMQDGRKSEENVEKAKVLEESMMAFFSEEDNLPSYGDLFTDNGEWIRSKPYGMDRTDYRWAMSIPIFKPNYPVQYKNALDQLLTDLETQPKGAFLCAYNAILTSMDTEIHDEDKIMKAMDYLVPQSVRPGKYLPMPYTIPELVDEEDGDPFHDVRPLVYSIAPWLSAVTNLGLRRLPMGIAARATKYLVNLENYEYKNAIIDVDFKGSGKINKLLLNGTEIKYTYQIPENLLQKGDNQLIVQMRGKAENENIMISSSLILDEVDVSGSKVTFSMQGFGKNVITFKNLKKKVMINDDSGNFVGYDIKTMDPFTYLEFDGKDKYIVTME